MEQQFAGDRWGIGYDYGNYRAAVKGIRLKCPVSTCNYNVVLTVKNEDLVGDLKYFLIESCVCPHCHGTDLGFEVENVSGKRDVWNKCYNGHNPSFYSNQYSNQYNNQYNNQSFYSKNPSKPVYIYKKTKQQWVEKQKNNQENNNMKYDKLCKHDAFCTRRSTCKYRHSDVKYHHYPENNGGINKLI